MESETVIITRNNWFICLLQQGQCGDVTRDFTNVAKSLGQLIDNKLTWESHINKLSKSFSAKLNIPKRVKLLQVRQLGDIHHKMILPNIIYCKSV